MEDSEYYKLQAEGSAWTHLSPQYRQRLFEAVDSLGDVKGKSVIDVGCGDGESVKYLLDKGAEVIGLEYSSEKVKYAVESDLPVIEFDIEDGQINLLSEVLNKVSADIVFCSHTLEHTRDALYATHKLKRLVKPGGKLLIIVPHEEEFPTANPSHTQWMSNDRIQKVKEVLEEHFTTVKEERKHRLEDEVWLIAEGRKA